MSDAKTITTSDNSMYLSRIGVDRRLNERNEPQASAIVMVRQPNGVYARSTKLEEDFSQIAENGTADEKRFANEAIAAIHNFEKSGPLSQERAAETFARPVLQEAASAASLAMSAPSPTTP